MSDDLTFHADMLDRVDRQLAEDDRQLARTAYTGLRRVLLGDGLGTVPVAGRRGWAYVHVRDEAGNIRARTWALNPRMLSTHGQAVWVGYLPSIAALVIDDVDVETMAAYYANSDQDIPPVVSAHGPAHELFGGDAVILSNRQVRELSVHPATPRSMAVHVFPGLYWDETTLCWYAGGDSADLTTYVPGTAGQARWLLISLDRAAGALAYTQGTAFTAGDTPYDDWAEAADLECPDGDKPLAVIYLVDGMSEVDWQHLQRPDTDAATGGGGTDTFPDHYGPRNLAAGRLTADVIAVQYDIVGHGAARVELAPGTLAPGTAGDWIDGSESDNQYIYVYVTAAGVVKLSDKAPVYPEPDTASMVFTALVNQSGWNGTAGNGLNASTIVYDGDAGEANVKAGMWLGVCASDDTDYSKFRGYGSGSSGGRSVEGQFARLQAINAGANQLTLGALEGPMYHNIAINDNDRLFAISGTPRYRQFSSVWYRCIGVVRNDPGSNLVDGFWGQGCFMQMQDQVSDETTTSATFTAINDMLQGRIVAEGPDWFLARFHGHVEMSQGEGGSPQGSIFFNLYVDGQLYPPTDEDFGIFERRFTTPPVRELIDIAQFFPVPPGPHLVEWRWRVTGGTGTLVVSNNYQAALEIAPARRY